MDMRRLGKTGLSIAPIVFGGNVFGWTADETTSFALLDALIVKAGEKIHRRAGVRMHHGAFGQGYVQRPITIC